MNWKAVLAFINVFLLSVLCASKELNVDENRMESSGAIQYKIDGQTVTSAEYDLFINGLLTEKTNWYCKEDSTGGTTGYELNDKNGRVYKVAEETIGKSQVFSVTSVNQGP